MKMRTDMSVGADMTIAYELGVSLYLNITNRCPCNCTFCIRRNNDGVNYGESLWLDHEPNLDEIFAVLHKIPEDALKKYDEVVFCGYGEPTERLDVMLECAKYIKSKKCRVRLNTNGLSDLINEKETAALLEGYIDSVSISLNAPDSETYSELCLPVFGSGSYDAIIRFAKDCKKYIPEVVMSVFGPALDESDITKCRDVCESLDIPMKVR